jgi:hypothetical protein
MHIWVESLIKSPKLGNWEACIIFWTNWEHFRIILEYFRLFWNILDSFWTFGSRFNLCACALWPPSNSRFSCCMCHANYFMACSMNLIKKVLLTGCCQKDDLSNRISTKIVFSTDFPPGHPIFFCTECIQNSRSCFVNTVSPAQEVSCRRCKKCGIGGNLC